MRPSELFEVMLDNPPSVHTIPYYAAKNGHQQACPPGGPRATYHLYFRVGEST